MMHENPTCGWPTVPGIRSAGTPRVGPAIHHAALETRPHIAKCSEPFSLNQGIVGAALGRWHLPDRSAFNTRYGALRSTNGKYTARIPQPLCQ
jgi:hypothetical protein